MTDQEINERIHAACGYVRKWSAAKAEFRWYGPDGHNHLAPDDYVNDLNAMARAEQVLRRNQFHFVDYTRHLWRLVAGEAEYGNLGYFGFDFVTSAARQRAEAFLRTIEKWEEA